MTASSLPVIFCAADTRDRDVAAGLAAAMTRAECGLKIGLEFFNAHGPDTLREIMDSYPELPLFLDLKFHDIPNTVAGAVRSVTRLQPAYINVHALGGADMMKAARDAAREEADKIGVAAPRILAVTLLTSMDEQALPDIGLPGPVADRVKQLAALTQACGLDGVVCSAHEIALVRAACGPDFALMVPGIRPAGSAANDQKRVMTPAEALQQGATHLVIGRPITEQADPEQAASTILSDLRAA